MQSRKKAKRTKDPTSSASSFSNCVALETEPDDGPATDPMRLLQPWEATKRFHHAVREGDLGFVAASLKAKPAIASSLDDRLMCAVNYAIKYRRIDVLRHLLVSGASPNQRGQEGVRPVHVAATCNATEALELLLGQKNMRLDAADDKGQTALHVACRRNHLDVVKILLEAGADIKKLDKDGIAMLHQPARGGNIELCQYLLDSGADLSVADINGVTPVTFACIEGQVSILEAFIRHLTTGKLGANNTSTLRTISVFKVSSQRHHTDLATAQSKESLLQAMNCRDNDGAAPLHHATQNRRLEIANLLLDAGAAVNLKRNDGNTSLHIAASLGYQEMAAFLLQHGANPAAVDKRRRTPLHECGLSNQSQIALLLIEKGADVNAADDQFMTPLHWACRRGHLAVAETLLRASARLDGHDVCMRTPLHWAVIEDRDSVLKRLLMEPGIERVMNKQDMYDKSALHYAAESGCVELIQQLLSHGADCSLVDSEERRPAHLAARLGHLDCLRLLVSATGAAGKSVGQRDTDESTSVLLAAEEGRFDVFRFLCDCGADFSAKDSMGRNALMLAASKAHFDIAKFILDRDCNVNAVDASKNSALHYAAKEAAAGDCVKLLLGHSAFITENNLGDTAVDFAVRVNNTEALDVFFSKTYCSWTMDFRRQDGSSHLDVLIEFAPEYASRVLDYCMETTLWDSLDNNFTVIYDYSLVDPGPDDPMSQPERYFALRTMARHKKLELLHHPLSSAVLQEKWKYFARYALWFDLVFYVLFLSLLTAFVLDNGPTPPDQMEKTGCNNATISARPLLTELRLMMEKCLVIAYVIVRLVLELVKAARKRSAYWRNAEVYFFLLLYAATLGFMWPPDAEPCLWNWMFGLVSIILAWSYILFQIEWKVYICT